MFKTLKSNNKYLITHLKASRMQSYLHQTTSMCFILVLLLMIELSNASPVITAEIVINDSNNNVKNGSLDILLSDTSIALSEKLSNKLINNNDDDAIEDIVKLNDNSDIKAKETEVFDEPKGNDLSEDENISDNKNTFYIVKAQPINRRLSNKNSKSSSSKQRKIFKADKNLQRLEKKSWKIPIKSLALYSENSKDSQAPQKMMDELTDLFDSFKDS